MKRYRVILNVAGAWYVRHVRANDIGHATEQARCIELTIACSGVSLGRAVLGGKG